MSDAAAYEESLAILRTLVADFPHDRTVTVGRMFNGEGVKVGGKFFAFVGRNGDLIAKLPEAVVRELVSGQDADPLSMGTRTMREWVRIPMKADVAAWRNALEQAYSFVAGAGS